MAEKELSFSIPHLNAAPGDIHKKRSMRVGVTETDWKRLEEFRVTYVTHVASEGVRKRNVGRGWTIIDNCDSSDSQRGDSIPCNRTLIRIIDEGYDF